MKAKSITTFQYAVTLILLGFFIFNSTANAENWGTLQRWLASHPNINADFSQRIGAVDESLQDTDKSLTKYSASTFTPTLQQGEMWLNLPQFLRWEIHDGAGEIKNLVLVRADSSLGRGDTWSYDPDLLQAIHQPLMAMGGTTPAEILLNLSRKDGLSVLKKHFTLTEKKSEDGVWLVATPMAEDKNTTPFQWFKLKMNDAGLAAIRIRDALDRVVIIEFSNMRTPDKLDSSLFNFIPPVGVDVIDSTL